MADLDVIHKLKKSGCHCQQVSSIEKIWGNLAYSLNSEGRVIGLSLFNFGYSDDNFPDDIFELTHLKYLSLYGNHLTRLPQKIYQLNKLQTLDVGNNKLTILDQLEAFSELIELNLFQNNLTSIPKHSIIQLEKLKILYLIRNPIEDYLPDKIGKLKKEVDSKINKVNECFYISPSQEKTVKTINILNTKNSNINIGGKDNEQVITIGSNTNSEDTQQTDNEIQQTQKYNQPSKNIEISGNILFLIGAKDFNDFFIKLSKVSLDLKSHKLIALLLILFIGGLVFTMLQQPSETISLFKCETAVIIADKEKSKTVSNVKLRFTYNNTIYTSYSDSEGYYKGSFDCQEKYPLIRLHVEAHGYETYERIYKLTNQIQDIRLTKKAK